CGVFAPGKVVQEDAHGVHADRGSPAEFAIDSCRVECVGLPHFKFIDRGAGDEIAADEPRLRRVPLVGALWSPSGGVSGGGEWDEKNEREHNQQGPAHQLIYLQKRILLLQFYLARSRGSGRNKYLGRQVG